ncbi:MAG: alpha/beta fold hydrolase [Gemmobacter sp.]|jgi:pimeloyl-ACP methyl ester carboxylesterase|nr:alpha/beta fold hydrolase [Gemmobacter sp.]
MAREQVHVIGFAAAEPAAVWAVARDFCGLWHPFLAEVRTERDMRGALIRAFTVQGEDTLYREQLTWFSDSDRALAYTHLEGIAGAESYEARLSVGAAEKGGSVITWTATLTAPATRAGQIAEGTKKVFEAGIAALAARAEMSPSVPEVLAPAAVPVELREMRVDDAPRLALTMTPERSGPLCLFLHGIGGGRVNWRGQLQAVAPVMRAAALDLRGYGDSTLGFRQSTVDDYCADILRIRDVLGADRLVLCGLSYGSWIATSFAMRHPEMLAGLVLSGGCTGMSEAGPEEREAFRVSREVPLNAGQRPADFAPAVVKVLAGPEAGDQVKADLLASMAAISAETYRDALICFTNPLERFDFARLTMPVLMMTGEHDRLAPPAEIRAVSARIAECAPCADVRFEVIDGAGHVCNVEHPDAYNAHLVSFLSKVAR